MAPGRGFSALFEGYELADQPGHLIRRAQQAHLALFAEETARFGITSIQYAVLVTLVKHPGIEQAGLAARIAMDPSTSGAVIARLAQRGLVARASRPGDRRVRLLYPTPEGIALVEELRAAVDRVQQRLLEPLAPGERETFQALLRKLVFGGAERRGAPLRVVEGAGGASRRRPDAPGGSAR